MTDDNEEPPLKMKPARTETFEHTISGLLAKRTDLFNEADVIRERLAEIKNDIGAVDRVLNSLGYSGDLDLQMPRRPREVIFGKGELTGAIRRELRHADMALKSREVAQSIISLRGEDARDRKYVTGLTRRVSKALRILRENGEVRSKTDDKGNLLWEWR